MDVLPVDLLNEILFRLNLKSLAKMRCTARSLGSHINNFKSEYFSRIRSGLLHISVYGSSLLCYHNLDDSKSSRIKNTLMTCRILGYCSGLLLLTINGTLCVANPFTKKFRFLNQPRSRSFSSWTSDIIYIGFAVDQVDLTPQSFKIVCIREEVKNPNKTVYGFEITAGDSWSLSETKITCRPSNLDDNRMRNPQYLDGSLHWLREDGSIVSFNPETEQARLILTKIPKQPSWRKLTFSAGNNSLTLISSSDKVINMYALENILTDPKWVLVRQIRNVVGDEEKLIHRSVVAYDSKCLVVELMIRSNESGQYHRVVHRYDLKASRWGLIGLIPGWCDANQDYCLFTPSPSYVIGLDDNMNNQAMILSCNDQKVSSLQSLMGLVMEEKKNSV